MSQGNFYPIQSLTNGIISGTNMLMIRLSHAKTIGMDVISRLNLLRGVGILIVLEGSGEKKTSRLGVIGPEFR